MRRALLAVVLLAGGLRLLEARRQYERFLPQTEPDEGYYEVAEALLSHGVLGPGIPNVGERRWRGPLYPVLGALSQRSKPEPGRLRVAQAFLGAGAAALAFALAAALASPAAAAAAGLAVALEPASVMGSLNIHVFYGYVLLALAAAAAWWAADPTRGRTLLLGLMLGASFLVRSAHFPLPFLLALLAPKRAGWLLLGVALAAAPRPLADARAGAVLLFGSTLGRGVESLTVESAVAEAEKLEPGFAEAYPGDAAHDGLLRLARKRIVEHPFAFAAAAARRLASLWLPLALPLALGALAAALTPSRPMLAVLFTALSFSGYALGGGVAEHRPAVWPVLLTLAACLWRGKPDLRWARWLPAGGAVLGALYLAFLWYRFVPRPVDERRFAAAMRRVAAGFRDSSAGRRLAAEALAASAYRQGGDVALLRESVMLHPSPQARAALWARTGEGSLSAALKADAKAVCGPEFPLDRGALPRAYFDLCLAARPKDAQLWKDRGILRFRSGDAAGARADLKRALELSPGDEQAAMSLEVVTRTRGR